jgi:hypothetical protein
MGFFDKLFGQQEQYPELAGDHTAARRLAAIRGNLEELSREVSDPMEVLPTDDGAYVFIGKPPKRFGIAWIEGGEIKSFKTLVAEHGMSAREITAISDKLREVYVRHHDAEHFSAKVAEVEIVVTPSEPMAQDVREILTSLN